LFKSGKKRAFTGLKTNKLNQPLFIPNLSPLVNIKKKKTRLSAVTHLSQDCAKAYDRAARKYHGHFAVSNFPPRPFLNFTMYFGYLHFAFYNKKSPAKTKPGLIKLAIHIFTRQPRITTDHHQRPMRSQEAAAASPALLRHFYRYLSSASFAARRSSAALILFTSLWLYPHFSLGHLSAKSAGTVPRSKIASHFAHFTAL
jgi:hypothetical protein